MDQIAIPPIDIAAQMSRRLTSVVGSAPRPEDMTRRAVFSLVLPALPRRAAVDELKRGSGPQQTDKIAQHHKAGIEGKGHRIAVSRHEFQRHADPHVVDGESAGNADVVTTAALPESMRGTDALRLVKMCRSTGLRVHSQGNTLVGASEVMHRIVRFPIPSLLRPREMSCSWGNSRT